MNNFIKQVIEEKFASKRQQRFFYAQAGKGGKKGKKWAKWAKEYSDDTDFENLPEKVTDEEIEKDIEEIVDDNGNIMSNSKPLNFKSKGITQHNTSDEVVKTGAASMGTHGVHGTHTSLRYWAENRKELKNIIENMIDEIAMDDALGYEETLGDDAKYEEAYQYFTKDLGLSPDEAKERLEKLGYDEKLKGDKIRLVEKNKKYFEEFIESIISKKLYDNDIVNKKDYELKEVNPIIKRQIHSLRDTLENNNLSIEDVIEYFKNNE